MTKTIPRRPRSARNILNAIGAGSSALLTVSGIALMAMVLIVAGDVLLRNVFGVAVTGAAEYVSQWMMPATVLFALAFTEWKNDHIRVTIVEDSLRGGPRQVLAGLGQLVSVIISAILAWSSLELAISSTTIGETVPMGTGVLAVWPIKLIIVAAWIWMTAQTLAHLVAIVFPGLAYPETGDGSADHPTTEGGAHA